MSIFSRKKLNTSQAQGLIKNPLFYFGFSAFVLLILFTASAGGLAQSNRSSENSALLLNPLLKNGAPQETSDAFIGQNNVLALETPDLKIIGNDFLYGISTPRILTTQTLGSFFGESSQARKEVEDYVIQPGDTLVSVADNFGISVNTILWANSLSKNSALKVGNSLVILPVSGVLRAVKSGDTISDIAKTYKAKIDDIIAYNSLANEGDIFVGDILIIPGGVMPEKAVHVSNGQTALPDSFFIYPSEGTITQGIHYYNAVDVANKCGTPIYATASGVVQRAVGNGGWNFGMGNHITIEHSGGVVTYYGHLMTLFVKPGEKVAVGDRIGLMGRTGKTTGCHVHFQVIGASNPLAKYSMGAHLNYK